MDYTSYKTLQTKVFSALHQVTEKQLPSSIMKNINGLRIDNCYKDSLVIGRKGIERLIKS